ncbi:hypothetical protein BVRB_6g135170 [Beta vulgaris subsp. vulgaris]|uniref:uncharacterized protein LOC104895683 n=1 Tax=Beta vulgaris subsp. vulgaris TaxID=3555 RepID=UPI00053F9A41|nr:uncharacterized protein LOC104895683 [Beta vulgaris subsp. vulgaris]KMT08793.1 hypothetical protein BVRB_6g135170 [Beta vulgaris subsp. vulgaris]
MAERARAGRKSHTSTADLLTWTEAPPSHSSPPSSATRSHQPSDGVSKVLFGGQITEEEAESFAKRKPSGYKLKEMTGSGIFAGSEDDATSESKTGLRVYQQALNGISQISFSLEESVTPKKPTSIPEVAKQRELSGTLVEAESDAKMKKQLSDAKCKELSGNDIFGPPPENPPRSLAVARTLESKEKDMGEPAPRAVRTSVRVSNPAGGQSNIMFGEEPVVKSTRKLHDQKFQELTGNDIFKGDAPAGSTEKSLSKAKLREMSGSNIFAEGDRVEPRDYFGGVRKPPGGESSIALV